MSKKSFPYSEHILQWVWNELLFDTTSLTTECGKSLRILNQGILNRSDGPDFKSSRLLIDGMEWHGSVELHLISSGWVSHNHHTDRNYNNVVLHVVAENSPRKVHTFSGSAPFTLNILPYIHSGLASFLSNFDRSRSLPCSGNLTFLSQEIFQEQIERSHQEYLSKKVDDFLCFFSPSISQSLAWKNALILSIFDGLGISGNRHQMRELASTLLTKKYESLAQLKSQATNIAFENPDIKWNYKGLRPNSHPSKRINTAIEFFHFVKSTPFEHFLTPESHKIWFKWCAQIGIQNAGLPKILYATVFLPSLYFLGKLFQSEKIIDSVKNEWNLFSAPIPKILLSEFTQLNISPSVYQKKLGSVHQLREYCKPKKCSECLVLKKAISS